MNPPGPDRCGDIALGFGPAQPSRSRNGRPWSLAFERGRGRLWFCRPSESWSGYPLRIEEANGRVSVLLGDPRDHWLRVDHDQAAGKWSVRTDRFATIQAYRRVEGDPLISTFSPALWGEDPELDWPAVAGFLALSWYPGDRMPVSGVRVLRPATTYTWDNDGRSHSAARWWTWDHRPDDDPHRDPAAEMADVLGTILDERLDGGGPVGLPLSGGLDSRSTLAVMTRPDAVLPPDRLRAFSYGYEPDSVEIRIASELAAARDLPITTQVLMPNLLDDLDVVLAATEGLVDLATCRQAGVRHFLRDKTSSVIAAHWGDVWFGMATPDPDAPLGDWFLARSLRRGREWLLDHVIGERVHNPVGQLRLIMAAEAGSLPRIGDRVVAATALKTEQWSLRFTEASLRMHQAATDPILPYYDERMADLVLSLPSGLLTGRRLQIDHLIRLAPDLAAVTWQATETDLFALGRRSTTGLPRRLVRALHRRVRPPQAVLENWEIQFRGPELDRWRRWLRRPDACAPSLVGLPAIDALTHRVEAGDRDAGHALSRLTTFCAWRERYT